MRNIVITIPRSEQVIDAIEHLRSGKYLRRKMVSNLIHWGFASEEVEFQRGNIRGVIIGLKSRLRELQKGEQ